MSSLSRGALVVSASITVGTNDAVAVAKGDTLTGVVLVNSNGIEETIESGEVVGFTMRPANIVRGDNLIFDGIPTYKRDVDGDAHWNLVEEVAEVRDIVLKITEGEDDDATTTTRVVPVDRIKEIEEVESATDEDAG